MRHKPNPSIDETEMAAVRKQPPAFGLFAAPEALAHATSNIVLAPRHVTAIKTVEQTATAGERELVERIHANLRQMPSWDADDVRDFLNEEGVPDVLTTRRRLASMCVNGLHGKRKLGTRMTRHSARSGRPITVWTCQPEDDS